MDIDISASWLLRVFTLTRFTEECLCLVYEYTGGRGHHLLMKKKF